MRFWRSRAEGGYLLEAPLAVLLFATGLAAAIGGLVFLLTLQAQMAASPEARICQMAPSFIETEVRVLPYCGAARLHSLMAWFTEWHANIAISHGATVGDVAHALAIALAFLVVMAVGFGLAQLWAEFAGLSARRILDYVTKPHSRSENG